jgi:hypothetical protein
MVMEEVAAAIERVKAVLRRRPGVPAARLRELVEKGHRCAPISNAVVSALPVGSRIGVEAA